jgi:two-component system, NtrC family, response regulator PilR
MLNLVDDKLTALIVDDDPIGLMILQSFLESMSIETHSAASVAEAKDLIARSIPSIAILDVQLPDGDAIDIMLAMREANYPTEIAFVTASLEAFPFYKCEISQPDMMFAKPLDQSAVRAWIGHVAKLHGLAWGDPSETAQGLAAR